MHKKIFIPRILLILSVIRKLRDIFKQIDRKLDIRLTKYVKATEGIVEEGKPRAFRKFIKGLDVLGDKLTAQARKIPKINYFRLVTKKPFVTLIIVTLFTLILTYPALGLIGNIQSDIEVYLPPGEPSTEILNEVREDWPTDLIIVCVSVEKGEDITDLSILQEMSRIEETLDYNKTDRGKNDSIFYVLSISTIIKELNQTVFKGNYSIPDEERTQLILSQISGAEELERLIRDTDGDGKNDSAVILMGVPRGADQAAIVSKAESVVKTANLSSMSITGQPAIMQAVQKRTVTEFMKILPLLFIFMTLVLFFFHRTLKLVVIALLPMLYTIGITFGFLGLIRDYVVVAPQVILVAPLLVAFAIADSIYIANRFAEEKVENTRERAIKSVRFVLIAIFLTSVTTSVAFLSLTIGALKPLFTIGLALAFGIIAAWLMTITLVPCLIILLNYRKRYKLKTWKGFGKAPVNNRKKIIVVATLILLISLVFCLPNIETSADYYLMAPQDEPSVIQMQEYSRKFEAGQPGMVLIRGVSMSEYSTLRSIEELEKMIKDEAPQTKTLSIVDLMKMVKLHRTMVWELILESEVIEAINETIGLGYIYQLQQLLEPYLEEERSYWWVISEAPVISWSSRAQSVLITEFYDSMSQELSSMFLNEERTRTLVFVDMPVMPIDETRETIRGVNSATESSGPKGTSNLAGMATVLVAANDLTITNQFITMGVALILCFICLAILFRSVKFAGITMLPIIFVVAYEPLAFVGADVELSLITMMIAAIIIGVGVDFCIHLTHHVRQRGLSLASVSESTEAGGISFLEAAITEVVALSAALIIPIASVRGFIIMVMIMLLLSLGVALFILPALYAIWVKERTKGVIIE